MNMPRTSLLFGFLLIVQGVGSFVATGSIHHTALIPAIPGVILLLCGIVGAAAPHLRMHVMHVAALIGLVGGVGGIVMGLTKISAVLAGTSTRPLAVWMQLLMGVLLLIFLVLCVRSFIAARRARKAA